MLALAEVNVMACDANCTTVVAAGGAWGGNWPPIISRDGGSTWAQLPGMPANTVFVDISMSHDGQVIFIAPGMGNVFLSTDSGASFSALSPPSPMSMWGGTAMSATGSVLYLTTSGAADVLKSTDHGATWSNVMTDYSWNMLDVDCSSDGTRLLVSDRGSNRNLYFSNNAGATLIGTSGIPSAPWGSVKISDSGQTAYGSTLGDLYYTRNGGSTWTQSSVPQLGGRISCIPDGSVCIFPGDGNGFSVGSYVHITRDSGTTLVQEMPANQQVWVGSAISQDGRVFFVGGMGTGIWRHIEA